MIPFEQRKTTPLKISNDVSEHSSIALGWCDFSDPPNLPGIFDTPCSIRVTFVFFQCPGGQELTGKDDDREASWPGFSGHSMTVIWGGIKHDKSMVMFRDFSNYNALFGLVI